MVHAVAAILMMAVLLGHIYIGTIGMKGAYAAMKTGYVDEGWAREHHELWYDDIRPARSRPAQQPVASGVSAPQTPRRVPPMAHPSSAVSP